MTQTFEATCPLCKNLASFNDVTHHIKYYKCEICTEFIVLLNAESYLAQAADTTLINISEQCRATTNLKYIYVISDATLYNTPSIECKSQLKSDIFK